MVDETKTNVTKLTPKGGPKPVGMTTQKVSGPGMNKPMPKSPEEAPKPDIPQPDWDSLSATERLEALRDNQILLMDTLQNTMDQLNNMIGIVKGLRQQMKAVVKVSEEGKDLTTETLVETVQEFKVEELKLKVDDMKKAGIIEPTEVSDDKSFVIGRVLNDKGEEINPRLQMMVAQVLPEDKPAVHGKKVGDKGQFTNGSTFEMLEVYNIKDLTPPENVNNPEVDKEIDKAEKEGLDEVAPQAKSKDSQQPIA